MSLKGGYQIIDFKNKELVISGEGILIDGINFNDLKNVIKHKKPILLTGLNVKTFGELNDIYANEYRLTEEYAIDIYLYIGETPYFIRICYL